MLYDANRFKDEMD